MLVALLAAALADTVLATADSGRGPVVPPPATAPAPVVRIAPDSAADTVAFTALGAELRMEGGGGEPPRRGQGGGARPMAAELRLTKRADALTPVLAARLAAGRRLAAVVVEMPGGGDTLRVRLTDVAVVAGRLVFPTAPADAEAQRLAQEIAVEQATADRAEAARQLAEAEALAEVEARDRRKLVPANALARARDQLRLLDLRLATARRQLALGAERAARAAAPTEEVTLRAERVEVLGAGGR